jgi:hypothetical protein
MGKVKNLQELDLRVQFASLVVKDRESSLRINKFLNLLVQSDASRIAVSDPELFAEICARRESKEKKSVTEELLMVQMVDFIRSDPSGSSDD